MNSMALWPVIALAIAGWVTWTVWRSVSRSANGPKSTRGVVLRDVREYIIGFDAARIWVRQRNGGQVNELLWEDLSAVYVVAIDRFPIGSISWMLHGSGDAIAEIPTDAEGAMDLFGAMQSRLPGFDHGAAAEGAGMLHGFRKLWPGPAA